MLIAIASDHAGFALKSELVQWLREEGREIIDLGPESSASVDYPVYGGKLAAYLAASRGSAGIAICGSGIGIAIAANRNPACRCAQVNEPVSAAFARSHNDANAIALGARLIGIEMAKACVIAFLTTEFEGGRHQRRVDMLSHPEQEPA